MLMGVNARTHWVVEVSPWTLLHWSGGRRVPMTKTLREVEDLSRKQLVAERTQPPTYQGVYAPNCFDTQRWTRSFIACRCPLRVAST